MHASQGSAGAGAGAGAQAGAGAGAVQVQAVMPTQLHAGNDMHTGPAGLTFFGEPDVLDNGDDPDAPVASDGDSIGSDGDAAPPLAPCPPDTDPHSIWSGRRFKTLREADYAIALWFNRARKRLVRTRTGQHVAVYTCGADGCDFRVEARHDAVAAADWGDVFDQAEAGFVFCQVPRGHASPYVCRAIPAAARAKHKNRQNVLTKDLVAVALPSVARALSQYSAKFVHGLLMEKVFMDPGYDTAFAVYEQCMDQVWRA